MNLDDIIIEELSVETEPCVRELIRRNLQDYDEAGSVLASTFRRLADLMRVYKSEGSNYFVLKDTSGSGVCLGGAGIGSLHGLPPSEGLGEVRDLVLDKPFRGQGLGTRLLKRCVEEAKALGYKRLYLETTPQMENAQKLFIRFGFRPVTQAQTESRLSMSKGGAASEISPGVPCYFILDQI
jgi:putative acetyltransferase